MSGFFVCDFFFARVFFITKSVILFCVFFFNHKKCDKPNHLIFLSQLIELDFFATIALPLEELQGFRQRVFQVLFRL